MATAPTWRERTARSIGGMVIVLMALGCSSENTRWENPNRPWEQWARDEDECRSFARDQAERDFARFQRAPAVPGSSRTEEYRAAADRFDAKSQRERLFTNCMKDRGYRPVPVDKSPSE